ncbi:hypothetical protein OC835_000166 [Tilletia horrida]|nr:hypothetical protein OC835_000166 [Tilletia horrida]
MPAASALVAPQQSQLRRAQQQQQHRPQPRCNLVVGPPAGQFSTLISKTTAIHNKHGPFDALFILGDLFSHTSQDDAETATLLSGSLTRTIPTYFTLGTAPLPPSIHTVITEGENDTPALPADAELRATGTFYERAPFVHPPAYSPAHRGTPPPPVTRFISLAKLANPKKVRWFMALNLPLSLSGQSRTQALKPAQPLPPNTTPSPYGMLGFERPSVVPQAEKKNGNANRIPVSAAAKRWGGAGAGGGDDDDDEGGAPNFRFATGAAADRKKPPASYVCRPCCQPGHFIQDCELANSKNNENQQQQHLLAGAPSSLPTKPLPPLLVPPEGYECRICLSPNHFVQRCPFSPHAARVSAAGADEDRGAKHASMTT